MQLKLTLERGGDRPDVDLVLTADITATVGGVAEVVARRDPEGSSVHEPTLRLMSGTGRIIDPGVSIADAGLVSGQRIALIERAAWVHADRGPAAATLSVLAGPDIGQDFPLRAGSNIVGRGRGCDVVLADDQVSKEHARINVGETIEIIDLGSSNGTIVGDAEVARAVVRGDDRVLFGESTVRIVHHHDGGILSPTGVLYNRSPRIDVVYEGREYQTPEPPEPFVPRRLPIIPLIAPVFFGIVLFSVTRQLFTVIFVALSPLMMLGNVVEQRIFGRRDHARSIESFRELLVSLEVELTQAAARESATRQLEHPETGLIAVEAMRRAPELWSYRPDARGFLDVRLGLGTMPSRNKIEVGIKGNAVPELVAEARVLAHRFSTVDDVPVVGSLRACGSIGFAGPRPVALPVLHAAIAQLTALHSPAELVLAAVAPSERAATWDWLKWLPHTASDHSPIGRDAPHLASSAGAVNGLVSSLEALLAARADDDDSGTLPAMVVVVEDDAPIDRSRLVAIAEKGRTHGIHLLWIASAVAGLPAACRVFVDVDPAEPARGRAGFVDGDGVHAGGAWFTPVDLDRRDAVDMAAQSRALCPVVDAGARIDDDSDLPRSVSLPSLIGQELLEDAEAVIDRWRTSNSLPAELRPRRKANHLRSVVGSAATGPLVLDLRENGPHALVGGTTGSGKSEFLQSWILGLALEHSAARVTFLFVDYKGGAAFAECVQLPHCVGLVTDLSPQLVQRALTSLNAELHHREELLNRKRKKDLIELEKEGDPDAPPSLVIVVDEFAALAQEVPEFVDGVINIAQRGRSLGLHLVLATQRPAGVITGNLRANTNLRVALRMADETDSVDVVDSKIAGTFDPGLPGRAVVKTGPGRLVSFQSGYVGGHTSDEVPPPAMVAQELAFGVGRVWDAPESDSQEAEVDPGPNDLVRLVANVRAAFEVSGMTHPRRPWLDDLAPVYDLANTPNPSRDDAVLTLGILDDPARQQQYPVAFHPDIDGNLSIMGSSGSGKSAALRTLGIVAGLGFRGGPCHVYGLDFGARGLTMLESLPHVGSIVNGDDDERVQRLLRMLRDEIDRRAERYSARRAGSIAEYRTMADQPDEPRLLLLLDNMAGFRANYEIGHTARWFDLLLSIAADGRPVGVHIAVTADRPGALPSALSSVIQKQVVLRLSTENDLLTLGVPADWFDATSPPGRGYLDGNHIQVMVLGGSANTSRQSEAIDRLAQQLEARGDRTPAPSVARLSDAIELADLPESIDGLPVVGSAGFDLAPLTIVPDEVFLIAGPPQSGRTTAMATIVAAVHRATPDADLVYMGPGRSFLRGTATWSDEAVGDDEIATLAAALTVRVRDGWHPGAIAIEDHAMLLNSVADQPVVELMQACRAEGVMVLVDGETGAIGSWPLQLAAKAGRHGIILQPDQHDGDQIFKTPLPRVQRSDFPPGRGFYLRAGRASLVQIAQQTG